ncbi:hypothetical protein AB0945_36575 [Streptomyces sp. NPDC005474]|uniref:hypothetical protein n=1 Tax=Streptomyces sp. NPDC005474 TaxID=3154878 RepID=UPI0034555367
MLLGSVSLSVVARAVCPVVVVRGGKQNRQGSGGRVVVGVGGASTESPSACTRLAPSRRRARGPSLWSRTPPGEITNSCKARRCPRRVSGCGSSPRADAPPPAPRGA